MKLDLAQKTSVVNDIDKFLTSIGGKYYMSVIKDDLVDRTEFLINTHVDNNFTPFAREGFIGELRQLKATEHMLQDLKAQLVDEIKEQTNTNI